MGAQTARQHMGTAGRQYSTQVCTELNKTRLGRWSQLQNQLGQIVFRASRCRSLRFLL